MRLDREQVAHVAWLARLALTDEELDRYASQLSDILGHIEKLQALPVDDIEPTAMAAESERNVTRPDIPRPSTDQAEILANAAETEDGSFKVRAILEDTA